MHQDSVCSEEPAEWIKEGDLIQQRFKIIELLGEGSFGQVYKIHDTKNNNEVLAVKVEEVDDEESMLEREIKLMIQLKKKSGFPQIKYYGQEDNYSYYIMNLLGPNLDMVAKRCGGHFSLQTILRVALQILSRIEALHSLKLIHRDIKPDNFLLGYGQQSIVHMIDFGLSKSYINPKGEHIKFVKKKGLIGTARYASVNAHAEMEQSRRDDLESIAYILVYLGTGNLPWMNLQIEQRDLKYAKIHYLKKNTKPEVTCASLPSCFTKFLIEVKNLEFTETPNYNDYRKLFQGELDKIKTAAMYDWEQLAENNKVKKKNLTMHMPPQLEIPVEQPVIKQELKPKQEEDQFAKFDQIIQKKLQNQSSLQKQRTNSPKRKLPIIINVVEQDCIIEKNAESHILVAQTQMPAFQTSKSQKQIFLDDKPLHHQGKESYVPSIATSRMNNYNWSEQEIRSEGIPIWNTQYQDPHSTQNLDAQNIMTGIIAKSNRKRDSTHKVPTFKNPVQNQVSGDDEDVLNVD